MRFIILLLTAISICATSLAQSDSETEKEIRRLEALAIKSILESDTITLKKIWAPEFMVNTPRNNVAPNRAAVLQIQSAGMINYSKFERIIEQIQIHGNVVVTMGSEVLISKTDTPGAKAGVEVKRRCTNIWMKKDGTWKQIARHASIICS